MDEDEPLLVSRHVRESHNVKNHWSKYQRNVWTANLFILTAILFAARVAMPVCAAAMAKEFGWSKAELGAIMGSFFWGYVTTQILGGYMADKIGGDKVLWISSLLWGSLTLITPRLTHISSSMASTIVISSVTRVLLGIFQGVHYPSMMSLLGKKICETKRSLPVGIVTSAANFGSLVCGGIGSIILEQHGWEKTFYAIGVFALVWTYFIRTLAAKPRQTIISIEGMARDTRRVEPHAVPWILIFSKTSVWAFVFAHFCMNNCFYILLSWLPTFYHEHFPDEKGWVYNVVPWLMSIPSSVLGGWISERLIKAKWSVGATRKTLQSVAMLGSAAFAMLLPFCPGFPSTILCNGLAVSLHTFHHSGVLVNPQDLAPLYAGSVFGVSNAIGAIPGFLGVYLSGQILHTSGSWTAVFAFLTVVNCAGISVFVLWGTGKRVV